MAPLRASPWPKLPLQFQVISPARLIISGCFSSMIKRKPSTSNPWVAGLTTPLPRKHQKLAQKLASSEQTPNSNSTTNPTIFHHGKYYRRSQCGWGFFKIGSLKVLEKTIEQSPIARRFLYRCEPWGQKLLLGEVKLTSG